MSTQSHRRLTVKSRTCRFDPRSRPSRKVSGPLVERHSSLTSALDRWASDDNLWLRRSALLAHLLPLRRGAGEWDRFVRYASQMLEEKEFFIRKAIGSVLREATQHLSPEDRDRLMAAYRDV